jgi:glycogen debranching enzyme
VDRLWDERLGYFVDEAQPSGVRPAVNTWAGLSPLALPDLPEEIGRRMIEEHLLNPLRYWLETPPPSVSADEPSFEPGRGSGWKRRYWRGPTWVNAAWLLWLGMVRLGYTDEARQMASKLERAILAAGMREYYNPHTGEGLGALDFAWTGLILEMEADSPWDADRV